MGTKTLSRLGETGFRGEGDFPCGTASKESTCNVGDLGSISGLGRSPGGGRGTPLFLPGESPWTEKPGQLVAKSQT